ncbi:MAG: hypothetical protein H0X62_17780, partial [Bacteroidetes bacterium]|nr:hypothetical protein [Bacteroidota bacterium]
MNKIFVLLFTFFSFTFFSCNNDHKKTSAEVNENTPVEEDEIVQREIQPGEMYHDVTYYENRAVKMEGNMIDGKKEGKWMAFHENGMPWSETSFEDGISEGPTTTWYPSGVKHYTGAYKNGQRSGNWKFYDEDGALEKEENY